MNAHVVLGKREAILDLMAERENSPDESGGFRTFVPAHAVGVSMGSDSRSSEGGLLGGALRLVSGLLRSR